MRNYLIKLLGGFSGTDDFINRVESLPLKEKHRLLTLAVKKSFNTITKEDILKIENGEWTLEGKSLLQAQLVSIQQSASSFKAGIFWRVIQKELRYRANRAMFIKSDTAIDMLGGKTLLFYIDIINSKVEEIVGSSQV